MGCSTICIPSANYITNYATNGSHYLNHLEYKNDLSFSTHSFVVDMPLNQSYEESTCTSVQSYNDKFLTIQLDSFENSVTIQGTAHIESVGYDDQSCHSVNKVDHSIDLKSVNETSTKKINYSI